MAVDGLGALALGSLFDRIGIWTMALATIVSAAAAPLVFLGNFPLAVIGMACWGVGTGAQDSVMRATISPDEARPAPAADRRARPHRLAAGIWLQLACLGGGRYRPLQASDR
jgi:MFS family permease